MILIDTSVWIDHLRENDTELQRLLTMNNVLTHPFVIGELAMGNLRSRELILEELQSLPQITAAHDDEVLHFIAQQILFGRGIGYIDAHLLAAVQMTPGTSLWTRDKRLVEFAARLSVAFTPRVN